MSVRPASRRPAISDAGTIAKYASRYSSVSASWFCGSNGAGSGVGRLTISISGSSVAKHATASRTATATVAPTGGSAHGAGTAAPASAVLGSGVGRGPGHRAKPIVGGLRGLTTADESTGTAPGGRAADPVVIEVRGVDKTFRIPSHRVDSIKERAIRPFASVEYREHRAVADVSFDVHGGEFFGILGRNGSGKSTLLKIMASIYRADAGTVRMAGRVAPFIELGVGFNPELTARENGVLNGVLMGLTMREARRRLDAMLDFAELQDFVDLKLKNYSSGMMVRLAFAVMVQAEADVMLIDEVLAVGDAAFMQKCMDLFHERRRAGKTIVLVTHDMATVQSLCDRALLLHDGELQFVGEPEEAALRYLRLNFGGRYSVPAEDAESVTAVPEFNVRTVRAQLLGAGHEPVANVELGRAARARRRARGRARARAPRASSSTCSTRTGWWCSASSACSSSPCRSAGGST